MATARLALCLVFTLTVVTTGRAQSTVSLQDTTTWIADFLETHGCSVSSWVDNRDGKTNIYKSCSAVTKLKGCMLTVRNTHPGSNRDDLNYEAYIDLSEVDRNSVKIDDSFFPTDGLNRGPGKSVGLQKPGGKGFPTSGKWFATGLSVDSAQSAARLQRALLHAVDLCVTQSPF